MSVKTITLDDGRNKVEYSLELDWSDKGYPRFPMNIAVEHFDRKDINWDFIGYDQVEGIKAQRETGGHDVTYAVLNDYENQKDVVTLTGYLNEGPVSGAEAYMGAIWARQVVTMVQRADQITENALDAVETVEYLTDVFNKKYDKEFTSGEFIEREFGLLGQPDFDKEAGNYIEAAARAYYDGRNLRRSDLFIDYGDEIETSEHRGLMPLGETSVSKGEGYLSHFMDILWQEVRKD